MTSAAYEANGSARHVLVGDEGIECFSRNGQDARDALPEAGSYLWDRSSQTLSPPNRALFTALADEWAKQTLLTSSIGEKAIHPAYQRIIGMGSPAMPLIIERLRARGEHWFWALMAISGENPVPPEDEGNIEAMTQSWLHWADQRGASSDGEAA